MIKAACLAPCRKSFPQMRQYLNNSCENGVDLLLRKHILLKLPHLLAHIPQAFQRGLLQAWIGGLCIHVPQQSGHQILPLLGWQLDGSHLCQGEGSSVSGYLSLSWIRKFILAFLCT